MCQEVWREIRSNEESKGEKIEKMQNAEEPIRANLLW